LEDKPFGECQLKIKEVAEIVEREIRSMDGVFYDLIAYCIMPNHVHLLFDTNRQITNAEGNLLEEKEIEKNYVQLDKIMKKLKGASSRRINQYLKRSGTFWHVDYWDHFIRSGEELWNVINYILNNPVKAGLVKERGDYWFSYYKMRGE
jgi:putative transposase